MINRFLILALVLSCLLTPVSAFSQIEWRCSGVDPVTMLQSDSDDIAVQLGANCLRIQLGFNSVMDGLVGEAYTERLEQEIDAVKESVDKIANSGMKTLISFYSPPGGFATRVAPAHHAMFSSLDLQQQYLDAVELIVSEFADNPNVIAIDLNNEPAIQDSSLCVGCCLLYTSPSPRDKRQSRMPSSA